MSDDDYRDLDGIWQFGAPYVGGVCRFCDGGVMFNIRQDNAPQTMKCRCPDRIWEHDGYYQIRWRSLKPGEVPFDSHPTTDDYDYGKERSRQGKEKR